MKFPFVMAFRGIFTILHQDIFKIHDNSSIPEKYHVVGY